MTELHKMSPPRTSLSLRGKIPVYLSAIRGNKFIGCIMAVLGKLGRKVNGGHTLPRLCKSFKTERLQRATEKLKLLMRPHYMLRMAPTNCRKSISRQEVPPPLSETELATLRTTLKELQSKWAAAEKEVKVSSASSAENVVKTKLRQQSEDTPKTSTLLDGVAKYVAPIPTYISDTAKISLDTAKGLMTNKDAIAKKPPAAAESSAAEKQKGIGTIPRWKVQGTTTNARTSIQLVTGTLVRAVKDAEPDLCLQELEDLSSHLHKHPWSKGLAVREGLIGALLFIRWRTQNMAVQLQVTETLDLVGYQQPLPKRGIRILCLDGGGMRGVVALEVLRQLEAVTGRRIHQIFDFICGVSTGAIIASFLGFHKKTIDEIEEIYKRLGQEIFTRNLIKGTTGWITSHAFYDSKNYEKILQGFVGQMAMSDTVRTPGTPKVAIVSTLVSEEKISPFIFRNYHYPYRGQSFYQGSSRVPIWAAVRASSAAPGYFDEFSLEGKIHHDGGLMTNNASLVAVHEAMRLWPNEELQAVVSLGNGRVPAPITSAADDEMMMIEESIQSKKGARNDNAPKALSLAKKFAKIVDAATDTEIPHVALHDLLPGSVYYRFDPVLREYLPLDCADASLMHRVREDTQMYLRRNWNRVNEACDQLSLTRPLLRRARDVGATTYEVASSKAKDMIS